MEPQPSIAGLLWDGATDVPAKLRILPSTLQINPGFGFESDELDPRRDSGSGSSSIWSSYHPRKQTPLFDPCAQLNSISNLKSFKLGFSDKFRTTPETP